MMYTVESPERDAVCTSGRLAKSEFKSTMILVFGVTHTIGLAPYALY